MKYYFFVTGIFWVFLCLFYSLSLNQKNWKIFLLGLIVSLVFFAYRYYIKYFIRFCEIIFRNILLFFSIIINSSVLIVLFFILINLINTSKPKNDFFFNKNTTKESQNFFELDKLLNDFDEKFYSEIKKEKDVTKSLNKLTKISIKSITERKEILNLINNKPISNPMLNDISYDKILSVNDLKLSPIKINSEILFEVYKLELCELSKQLKNNKNAFIIKDYMMLWKSLEKLLNQKNNTLSNFILFLKIGDVLTEFYFDYYYYFEKSNLSIDFKAINGYYQFSFENAIKYEYHIFNTLLNMFKTNKGKIIYWPIINYNYELSKQNEYLYHEMISYSLPIYEYQENNTMENFVKMKVVSPASYMIIKSISRPDFVSLKLDTEMLKNKLNLMESLMIQKNKFKNESVPYDRLTGVPFIFKEKGELLIIESLFKKYEFKCVIKLR